MQKRRKEKPEGGVKISETDAPLPSVRTERVPATASFADSPLIMAAAALQSPKPRGAKRGEMKLPRWARRLSSGEEAFSKPGPRFSRSQQTAEAARITVKAFFTKSRALFKAQRKASLSDDAVMAEAGPKGGVKAGGGEAFGASLFKTAAIRSRAAVSHKSRRISAAPSRPGKREEQRRTHTGSLAPQGIRGISRMALSPGLLSLRAPADAMAGTAQPKPIIRAGRASPERPNLLIRGSEIMESSLRMGLSPRRERQKKSRAIEGTKERTLITPGKIPSVIIRIISRPAPEAKAEPSAAREAEETKSSPRRLKKGAVRPKVRKNTAATAKRAFAPVRRMEIFKKARLLKKTLPKKSTNRF